MMYSSLRGFPGGAVVKHPDASLIPESGRSSEERGPAPVLRPGKRQGQRSLAGHSPGGCRAGKDLATEQHSSLYNLSCLFSISATPEDGLFLHSSLWEGHILPLECNPALRNEHSSAESP